MTDVKGEEGGGVKGGVTLPQSFTPVDILQGSVHPGAGSPYGLALSPSIIFPTYWDLVSFQSIYITLSNWSQWFLIDRHQWQFSIFTQLVFSAGFHCHCWQSLPSSSSTIFHSHLSRFLLRSQITPSQGQLKHHFSLPAS